MTIFAPPILTGEDQDVLGLIQQQRQQLRYHITNNPRRWGGFLRRNTMARAIRGSNSIEGYHATMDDAVAAVENDEPMDTTQETWREILGYRNALTYILQLSEDPHFEFHAQLLRSLHFMMLQHDLQKMPGRWRPGDIFVVNNATGEKMYEGPDALLVPGLVDELFHDLNKPSSDPIIVKAAMAHLNLTMIHPFKDGNGRMARALQTLVLSREGIVSPVFSSIEEWLGRNTQAYYDILASVGQGSWHPQNDPLPWVRFCFKAHYQQAHTLVKRNNLVSKVYEDIAMLVKAHGLPERTETALVDAAFGLRVRAGRYREDSEISDVVASRDLKRLVDQGFLIPHGERRGRFYSGSEGLLKIRLSYRVNSKADDPYEMVRSRALKNMTPRLPGL